MSDVPSETVEQALTFKLGDERFALEVLRVREIIDIVPVTRIPNAPPFAPGVINARGSVVPFIDLRHAFGIPERRDGAAPRVVVFDIELDDEIVTVATPADAVESVVSLDELTFQDVPDLGARWDKRFAKGIAQIGSETAVVLDIDRVFNLLEG